MDSVSEFVIGSKTLAPGAVITVQGILVSPTATPTDMVIGTSTEGLGGFIKSGLGGAAASSTPFEGSAGRTENELRFCRILDGWDDSVHSVGSSVAHKASLGNLELGRLPILTLYII